MKTEPLLEKIGVIEKESIVTSLFEANIWVAKIKDFQKLTSATLSEVYSESIDMTIKNGFKVGWKTCLIIDNSDEIQWSKLIVPGNYILQQADDAFAIVINSEKETKTVAQLILKTFGKLLKMKIFYKTDKAMQWLALQPVSRKDWAQINEDYRNYISPQEFRETIVNKFNFVIPIVCLIYAVMLSYYGFYGLAAFAFVFGISLPIIRVLTSKSNNHEKYYILLMSSFAALCLGLIMTTGGLEGPYNTSLFAIMVLSGLFLKGKVFYDTIKLSCPFTF